MTAAAWWGAGTAAALVLVSWLAIPVRRCWAVLVGRGQAGRRAEALLWAWLSPAPLSGHRPPLPYR
jgi:hypothetical protein